MARFLIILLCAGICLLAQNEDVNVESASAESMSTLPSQAFLKEIRKPLRIDAWGEFTGSIVNKGAKGKRSGNLRVRITFTKDAMFTQIVLNDVNVYSLEQKHSGENSNATVKLDLPAKETAPGLFDFGMRPEDMSFSFIYWDFVEELPREKKRMSECRVFRLASPDKDGTVLVWFHASHGFPLEARWFKNDAKEHWCKLELKGAKRHANGLWFVKEMRLEGKDWKTQVSFDHVELNAPGE